TPTSTLCLPDALPISARDNGPAQTRAAGRVYQVNRVAGNQVLYGLGKFQMHSRAAINLCRAIAWRHTQNKRRARNRGASIWVTRSEEHTSELQSPDHL